MKSTKFFAAFLAVLMLFGTLAASAAGFNDLTYKDQPEAFKKALMLSEMGVIKGDDKGNANLGANVTRAEMAAFIFRLGTSYVDIVGGTNSTSFKDIPADAWYISNVVWCAENGIIEGRNKETFDPQADVSYDEAIKMVCTLLGYKNKSYPLGYNLAFRDILKKNNTTLEKALPNYKGDIVGKRYPITRGEVIDLLNIAYTADLVKADGTSTGKTLATTVWGSWGDFKENNVIVVATPAAALPGYTVAAKDKIVIAPYDAKKVISATTTEVKPADIGLASTDCLGSAVSYYTMTKAGKTAQILKELTVVTPAKYYDNAEVSFATKKEGNPAADVNYVTVAGNQFKASEAKKYTAVFTAKDKANFTGTASDATVFFNDLKAGKKVYAVALDLFADGTIEYFDYAYAEIGIVGKADKKISKDKDATEIKALVASSVADVKAVKKSNLTVLAGNYFTALINNKAAAKENDIVVFYTFGAGAANKLTVIDEIVTPFAGTVTKVVNTSIFTVEKADGSKADYTINTAAAPFINANVLASGAAETLKATVKANFVVYNNKILVAYQDEDIVTPITPDYSGNKIALFYGLAARDVITDSKYVWNPEKAAFLIEVTPSYKYYALVAYEDDPSKIVKVPVSGKAGCIGSCVALEAAFDQAITLSYVPGTVSTQKPMASCQTATHEIGGIETDGSAAVILTEILDSKNKGTGVFDISENITLKSLSAKTSEELVQGAYIVQNFVTGKYELYDASNVLVKRFTTDANSVVIELTALKQDGKANLINAEAGQLASYSAKKSALGTISGQDEFLAGPNTCLVAGTTGNFIFEGDILRKAVVLKDNKAPGQIISKAADKTKEPYAFQILQSVDSITVNGLVATVAYTTYNPATKATTQATISVTADKAANVQSYGYAVATDLSAFVGKVLVKALTVDAKTFKLVTTDCFKDLSAVGTAASLALAADKKSQNLAGSYVDAQIKKIDANADNSVYYVTATVGGREVTLKLADACNIIKIAAPTTTIQGFQKVAISAAVAVEIKDAKNNMVYNNAIESATYRFFVDSDLNIVFGAAAMPN